jgi:hypothetical protein
VTLKGLGTKTKWFAVIHQSQGNPDPDSEFASHESEVDI